MPESRVHKSLLNAKVNLVFYFLSLFFSFYSRKIFLECLGDNFIGLTGTLGNILGYLNLAELGIGSCISYFLYKPLQCADRTKIREILSVFGFLYRRIGQVILLAGCAVSLLFPWIFVDAGLETGIIYFSFFSLLGSSLIGYFINYRQILLQADQKNYLVAIYFQSAGLVKTALQIFLAYTWRNLYVWVAVEFLFGVLGCIILNWKINREYPWLHTDIKSGKDLLKHYPDIFTKTRQIFVHQIKDFILNRSDELFVFAFVSLQMVAFYGNYLMIVNKISLLFKSVLDSVNAGIGNLVAEGDKPKMMRVFWELSAIRHFIAGLLCFSIYHLIQPFISLWLGSEYLLDNTIVVLLVIYIYVVNSRGVVDMFNHSHGLYADTWSAWVELALNVGITLVAGWHFGIAGILLGKIVSVFVIVIFWKPYYLFRDGLHLPVSHYWNGAIRYYLIFLLSFAAASWTAAHLPIDPAENYLTWLLFALSSVGIYTLLNALLLLLFARGTKDCLARLHHR